MGRGGGARPLQVLTTCAHLADAVPSTSTSTLTTPGKAWTNWHAPSTPSRPTRPTAASSCLLGTPQVRHADAAARQARASRFAWLCSLSLRSRFGPDGAPTVPHVLPVLRCQRRAVMPGTSAHARVCGLWSCACAHDVLRWLWCVCRCTNGLPTWGLGSRSTSQATRSLLAWLRKCVV